MKLKRKILALFLISYLMAFTAPFVVMAADDTVTDVPITCTTNAYSDSDGTFDDYKAAYNKKVEGSTHTCGITNTTTGYLEKGDCTANGQIITELTEPVAPTTVLNTDEDGKVTQVIDVYQGICCIDYDATNSTCNATRNTYSATYDECVILGSNCQQRQWLIASTGMGLLKLFVKQMYTWGAFAVGIVAVATMILNGVRISMSGVSGDISDAKNKIFQAIAGIVLLFMSALILYTVNPDFFS